MAETVRLQIVLKAPPAGYAFCLQRGKGGRAERLDHVEADGGDLVFELAVAAREGSSAGLADFGGPFVQGRPGGRFFYLCVGESSTLVEPQWSGRVKVPLSSVPWATVRRALAADRPLRASYAATRANGRPALASVPLMGEGWTPA